jgi:hypothetical protein
MDCIFVDIHGSRQVSNFLRCSSFGENSIFLVVNVNPTPLHYIYVVGVYLVYILLLFIGQDSKRTF